MARETYAELRARILKRGCFSAFEATETATTAKHFDRLCRDPEIITIPLQFPMTKVIRNALDAPTVEEGDGGK